MNDTASRETNGDAFRRAGRAGICAAGQRIEAVQPSLEQPPCPIDQAGASGDHGAFGSELPAWSRALGEIFREERESSHVRPWNHSEMTEFGRGGSLGVHWPGGQRRMPVRP